MSPLARFTVELHQPDGGWAGLQRATSSARQAAAELRAEGRPVRFLRSIFVPEDDACFFLYEGDGRAIVQEAAVRAGLDVGEIEQTLIPRRDAESETT